MLTADERSCPRAELLNQGASDIIAKPFDPREILAYVRSRLTNALTLRRLQDAASRALLNAAPQIASRPAPETKPPATARTESTVERERLHCELARVQAAWGVLKLSLAETQQAPGAELNTALRRIGEVITPALSTDNTRTPTGAGKRAEEAAAESETGNGVTLGAHTDPWVDRAALLARCMNKEALATKLIAQFCDELPEYVAKLTAALESADAEDLRQTAHKLKGASANLCVWPINKLAIQLEANGRENDLAAAAAPVGELGTISKQLVTAAIQSTTSVQELDRWR
jgi:HPt (histidine-containing phosphotransfer) domain-containing protein